MKTCDSRGTSYMNGNSYEDCKKIAKIILNENISGENSFLEQRVLELRESLLYEKISIFGVEHIF